MNKKLIRKMLTAAGGPIYEEDWSDKLEPYAAGVGLAGDVVGLGAAATGIGIPVGTAIAGFANIPNLIIDGYQTARDTWRSFNDNGNSLGSAAWNGGEFILDAAGLKALQYINKATKAGVASEKYLTSTEKALDSKPWKRVGTGHGRVKARQSANHKRKYNAKRNKALEESNVELAKRGVRPALGLYYQQKLTDEMAKRGYGVAVNDAIKSANRTVRLNLGAISGVSGGTNIYHLLPKHKSGGLIRKMLTAAGGPLRIKFTPEQIALFESQATRVPGMNNSGMSTYRIQGVQALLHLEQEALRKEEEIKSRMEMRPTLKRKATTAEKLRGKKDEYELRPLVVGMSGTDPVGEFILAGIGLNGIGALAKTGLWNIAKYAPTTQLGNWGRLYFVGSAFKNSFNAPHSPIYERVSYSKYSADAANPKERDLVIQHFKSRYPNSGLQVTTPLKISGFTYDNLLKVGELPLSEEGKAIADVMARRMKNYKLREGLDPNIVHFGYNRFSMSGINGMMNQIKNDKTIAYMPLKNSDNYGGLYEGGEAFLKLNPWREKPYIYSLIHEGVSHMTDDFVNDLRTPVSGKKLLSDLSRSFDGTKASDSMYGRISYPNDIYDEKLIEKILHKDSMKAIESRSTNWEMITDLYRILAKEKGISYKQATELPDSEFGAFIEKNLDSPEKLSKFMEKFDNLYLLDYSNLMKAGTKELANQFYKRIKGMLKYGPSLITGGYFLTSQKQGGKMNILEFLKNGSGIYIKKKNRGSFTRWCGGNVTEECIRRGKASSNPKIRKKATFADSARHFKHRLGGILYFLLKGGNLLNSGTALINGIGAGILYFTTNNQLSKMLNEFNESMKAKYNFLKNNINMKAINLLALQNIANLKLTNPEQNFGTIDLQLELERLRKEATAEAEQLAKYLIALELSLFNNLINAIKGENTASLINGIFNIGKTALLNYKPKNNKTNIQTTTVLPKLTTNTYTSNYSLTTPSLGLFNTPLNNSLKFWNV